VTVQTQYWQIWDCVIKTLKDRKVGNCDALQIEVALRRVSHSGFNYETHYVQHTNSTVSQPPRTHDAKSDDPRLSY